MNGGINCIFSFVVLIILNALKKLTYYTAVPLSQKILNFAVRSFVCSQENVKKRGNFSWKQLDFHLMQLYDT